MNGRLIDDLHVREVLLVTCSMIRVCLYQLAFKCFSVHIWICVEANTLLTLNNLVLHVVHVLVE